VSDPARPSWIRTRLRTGRQYTQISELVQREGLHTVRQEAGCPNIHEYWEEHNVETVPRIFRSIRPGFRYDRSLDVIAEVRAAGLVTKSNLTLGLGETSEEASATLRDLRAAGCELVTVTQYLRPTPRHHPVARWVKPEEFVSLAAEARAIGFAGVMSGPLVRSSYRAGRLYDEAIAARG